jgi:type I restriction-modification system DNA methylase subunit
VPNYRTLIEVIVDYFTQYPEEIEEFSQEIFADCFVSANPPFNDSDWRGALLREDSRWQYSEFPVGSANDKDDFDFVERFTQLKAEFAAQLQDEARLNTLIAQNWAKVQP